MARISSCDTWNPIIHISRRGILNPPSIVGTAIALQVRDPFYHIPRVSHMGPAVVRIIPRFDAEKLYLIWISKGLR